MSPWAILSSCIITKGEGHYDFDTLIQQLIGMTGPGGLEAMPRPMEDIGGGNLTGVEADAVWEAIYQGLIDANTAAIVHAGPQPGMEDLYQNALQAAISAGAGTINAAVNSQNAIWEAKRQEAMMSGKDPSKIPAPLPAPFESDLGRTVLNQTWRNGQWGPMQKDNPWIVDAQGQMHLRIGNRDKENKFPESWARPYAEGLKQMRGGRDTKEFIESHRVQPNSVYINHEAGKHIYDLMDSLARQGYTRDNLTPDIVRQVWASHPVLSKYMPHQLTPLQHTYNIRNTSPHVQQPDAAEQMVEQQQAPTYTAYDYSTYLPEGALQTKRGVDILDRSMANYPHYGGALYDAFRTHYKDMLPDNGQAFYMQMGQGRNRRDRLVSGIVNYLNQQNPGFVPEHVKDPSTLIRPQARAVQPERPVPPEQPPAVTRPQPVAPPVPVEPQAPPVPVQRQPVQHPPVAPPAPPVQHPQPQPQPESIPTPVPTPVAPNIDEVMRPPRNEAVAADRGPSMGERLAQSLGRGAGRVFGGLFGKEEIDAVLEDVQREMALQDQRIVKAMPSTAFSASNPTDIALAATHFGVPSSEIAAILNSRGHWEEIAKSMNVDFDTFQVLKVVFE